jgi:hypothetical protein
MRARWHGWWLPTSLLKITHCHCLHYCVGDGIMPVFSTRSFSDVSWGEVRSLTDWRNTRCKLRWYLNTPKVFLENPVHNCEKPIIKVFWKDLGKGFSPKNPLGFQENLYGLSRKHACWWKTLISKIYNYIPTSLELPVHLSFKSHSLALSTSLQTVPAALNLHPSQHSPVEQS